MFKIGNWAFPLAIFAATCFCGAAAGQQIAAVPAAKSPASYDVKREATIIGTVRSFTAAAQAAPLGAHATLQTSAGILDVHLGDGRLLAANHFTIQAGDTLRIIGENVAYGNRTQFVARLVQKGTQALEVRSVRGIPLSYMAPRGSGLSKTQGGVL